MVLTAEEIVAPEVIASDPNRVIVPGFKVSAVAHAAWGAHPAPVPGYYNRDHQAFLDYREESKTPEAFAAWLAEWVDGTSGTDGYLARLGEARLNALRLKGHAPSAGVDYGY